MKDDILLFGFLVGVVCLAIGIVVLSIKQVIDLRHQAELRHRMRCLRRPKQPWVTVLVDAIGKSDFATALTLKSLNKVHYYNYDIVAVEGAGLTKKQSAQALQLGYSKSQRGAVVIVLDAGEVVDKSFIKRAVASQNKQAAWRVAACEKSRSSGGLQLMDVIRMLEVNYWQIFRTVKVFEAQKFVASYDDLKQVSRYESDARNVMNILFFAVISLTIIISHELILIIYLWLLFTAYGLGVIWLTKYQTPKKKVLLMYSAPLAGFFFPVVGVMRLFSRT